MRVLPLMMFPALSMAMMMYNVDVRQDVRQDVRIEAE